MNSQATHVESQPTPANYADVLQGVKKLAQKYEKKPERHRTAWQTNDSNIWSKLDKPKNKA